ncbi:MAG: insulinase family protein [Planctomycetes bacterium]|nr:insulinase family protein [Planctomycetota bacterium]
MIRIAALALVLAPQEPPAADPLGFVSRRLDNGVRVHAIELGDATRVAVFTFLPVGLANDPLGRAQFAHLAEHMLIRATDSERLQVGGMSFNGETTGSVQRLESLGPLDDWKDLVGRHADWLSAREFDADVLEREKLRIEGEERNTVPQGLNHKWAIAAWSQVVAGSQNVRVHGDVATATVPQIERYVRDRVRLADARIFVAGPISPTDVIDAIERAFGDAPGTTSKPTSGPSTAESRPHAAPFTEPGHRDVTWDFDARQYLEWFPLPADLSGIEAELLRNVVAQACFQVGDLRRLPGRGSADVVVRDGRRFLLFTAAVPDPESEPRIREAFADAVDNAIRLAGNIDPSMLAAPFRDVPDFEAHRARIHVAHIRELVEANWLLQVGYACARTGKEPAELAAAFDAIDPKRVAKRLSDACESSLRRSASLHPPVSEGEPR